MAFTTSETSASLRDASSRDLSTQDEHYEKTLPSSEQHLSITQDPDTVEECPIVLSNTRFVLTLVGLVLAMFLVCASSSTSEPELTLAGIARLRQ